MSHIVRARRLPLLVIFLAIFSACSLAIAQDANQDQGSPDLDPRFAMMTKEIGAVCGPFLPNTIPGITEQMPLCGARFGFKISQSTTLEPQLLAGASTAQSYILGSLNFRGDVSIDDLVGSYYGGGTIHYATAPVYNGAGIADSSQTNVYFGVDVGGAVWWMFNEWWGIRTDLQFNFNPGTSLFVGFGIVMRFDPETEGAGNQTKRHLKLPFDLASMP